jgi:hypothetical protein
VNTVEWRETGNGSTIWSMNRNGHMGRVPGLDSD